MQISPTFLWHYFFWFNLVFSGFQIHIIGLKKGILNLTLSLLQVVLNALELVNFFGAILAQQIMLILRRS